MLSRSASGAAGSPNILYIMADDHAAHAISAYGSKINRTPNIDRIAAEGMRFDNCFCTNSICTPSRGVHPHRQVQPHQRRQHACTTARRRAPERGQTAAALRLSDRHDRQMASAERSHRVRLLEHPAGPGRVSQPGVHRDGPEEAASGYCTDLITDFALDFLKNRDPKKPFFLMCHHKAPHRPWQPDAKHAAMYDGTEVPEPFNLLDHYENRSKAAANATLQGRREHEQDRPEARHSGGSQRRRAAQAGPISTTSRTTCVASPRWTTTSGGCWTTSMRKTSRSNTIVIYTSDQGFFLGDHG